MWWASITNSVGPKVVLPGAPAQYLRALAEYLHNRNSIWKRFYNGPETYFDAPRQIQLGSTCWRSWPRFERQGLFLSKDNGRLVEKLRTSSAGGVDLYCTPYKGYLLWASGHDWTCGIYVITLSSKCPKFIKRTSVGHSSFGNIDIA